MISTRKLLKLAKKWQKFTAIRRSRISFQRTNGDAEPKTNEKGHFVVYTADNRRFVFPLSYLKIETFRQLLIMSEEEFGFSSDGPIVLPFSAQFMEYIISLIQRDVVSTELEKSLLTLVSNDRCLSSIITHQERRNQGLVVC